MTPFLFPIHSRPLDMSVSISSGLLAMPIVASSFILPLIFSATTMPTLPEGYFFFRMNIFCDRVTLKWVTQNYKMLFINILQN